MGYTTTTFTQGLLKWDLDALRKEMMDALGDLSGFEVWGNLVLLGVACSPIESKGGFIIGNEMKVEDVWQGKVGVILKIGPDCFTEKPETFNGRKPEVGDYVYHNVNNIALQMSYAGPGWKKTQLKAPNGTMEDTRSWNGWPIRLVQDTFIYGRVSSPELVL